MKSVCNLLVVAVVSARMAEKIMIHEYHGLDKNVGAQKAADMKVHLEAIQRDYIVKPRIGDLP